LKTVRLALPATTRCVLGALICAAAAAGSIAAIRVGMRRRRMRDIKRREPHLTALPPDRQATGD